MSNCRVIVLMLLGVFALVAVEYLLTRRGERSSLRRLSLVEMDSPVAEIEVVRSDEPPVRLTAGESWQIVAPYRGKVHVPAVRKLIDALTLSSVLDCINDSELVKIGRTRADFSLAEPHLKLKLRAADGTETSVGFGVPTPSADGVYAAVDGLGAVFIVPTAVFDAADVTADGLRQRELFAMNPESVCAMSIRHGDQAPTVFVRDVDGWHCGKHPVSMAKFKRYLEELTAAQALSFVWPVGASNEPELAAEALLSGYGLDVENAVMVSLKGGDGVEQRLSFGKESSPGAVYALAQDGTAVVTVPASLLDETAKDPARFTDLRLFPVEASSVSAFTLIEGEVVYTLVRGAGGAWRIESPIVAEADQEVVDSMLERIVKLTASDSDVNGLSVSLASDSSPVKVAAAAVLPRNGLDTIRSRRVLGIDGEAIRRLVRIANAKDEEATSVLYSRERKAWNVEKPEGRGEPDEASIGKVVRALADLKAVAIVKLKVAASDLDDYGLDTPYMTIAVDQDREGAVRRNLMLGSVCGDGRYATVGSTDAVFVLSEDAVEQLTLPLVKGL